MPKTPEITYYGIIEYDMKCNLINYCQYINKLQDVTSISCKIVKRALAYIFITLTTKTYIAGLTRNHTSHFVCF